jgi:hypothetical protein
MGTSPDTPRSSYFQVVQGVRAEIERYKEDPQSTQFRTIKQIAADANVNRSAVERYLKIDGLYDERQKILRELSDQKDISLGLTGVNPHSRYRRFIDELTIEIACYESGETTELRRISDLAEAAGITRGTAIGYLRTLPELQKKRRDLISQERRRRVLEYSIEPSPEAAWLVGIAASGGSVSKNSFIFVNDPSKPELTDKIQLLGEGTFQVSPTRYIESNKNRERLSFFSTGLAEWLGDLRRESWIETVFSKHKWIIEREEYTWKLIEAFFETRGYINYEGDRRRIGFRSNYRSVVYTLLDLLTNLGAQRPSIRTETNTREGIRGVEFNNDADTKLIASNISSADPEKEKKLALARAATAEIPVSRNVTTEAALAEAMRLYDQFGRFPPSNIIQELRKQGKTLYSNTVYTRLFGDNTSFVAAADLNLSETYNISSIIFFL